MTKENNQIIHRKSTLIRQAARIAGRGVIYVDG